MDDDRSEPLLVDLSQAPAPDENDVKAWAAAQSVFVSSVMGGMTAERQAVVAGIRQFGSRAVWFEDFGGMDDDPEDAYLGQVASSTIYLGILGRRYGTPLKSGYSATHAEYNEAERRGRRMSVWVTEAEIDGPQRDFLNAAQVFHTTGRYSSPEELSARVAARLRVMAGEALAPWVKVGHVIFRAQSVHEDGTHMTITGQIHDATVTNALVALRPSNSFGRNSSVRITWPGGTASALVNVVSSVTTSALAREVTITSDVVSEDGTHMTITGQIRDATVANALVALRPSNSFGRNSSVRITWPGGTASARVNVVSSVTTSALAREVTITADIVSDDGRSSPLRMAMNEYTADDLVEVALRCALLGETNPLGSMAFMAPATNPLPGLEGLGLSEDAFGQVARLLLTEELEGHMHAGRITTLDLSPSRNGKRQLRLGWMPEQIYTNVRPEPRLIEGEVSLP